MARSPSGSRTSKSEKPGTQSRASAGKKSSTSGHQTSPAGHGTGSTKAGKPSMPTTEAQPSAGGSKRSGTTMQPGKAPPLHQDTTQRALALKGESQSTARENTDTTRENHADNPKRRNDGKSSFDSHRLASAKLLREIIDAPAGEYSTSEKINAIKELRILTGDDGSGGSGPGAMTASQIRTERERLRALLES